MHDWLCTGLPIYTGWYTVIHICTAAVYSSECNDDDSYNNNCVQNIAEHSLKVTACVCIMSDMF